MKILKRNTYFKLMVVAFFAMIMSFSVNQKAFAAKEYDIYNGGNTTPFDKYNNWGYDSQNSWPYTVVTGTQTYNSNVCAYIGKGSGGYDHGYFRTKSSYDFSSYQYLTVNYSYRFYAGYDTWNRIGFGLNSWDNVNASWINMYNNPPANYSGSGNNQTYTMDITDRNGAYALYYHGNASCLSDHFFYVYFSRIYLWSDSYTITLNKQSGTGGTSTKSVYWGDTPGNITVPTKSGFNFNGYYTAVNGGGTQWYNASGVSQISKFTNTSNTTLYAYWTPNSHYLDIKGRLDGVTKENIEGYGTCDVYVNGSIVANDVTDYRALVAYGASYEITDIKAATGHTYNGVYDGSLTGTIGSSDVTATLKFTTNTYTVSYVGNGFTGGSTASSSHTYGVAKNLTANGYTRTGYTFSGWAKSATGAVSYTDGQSVTNITSQNNHTVLLYAKWSPITYSVKYNGNGNTGGSMANTSHTYNSSGNLRTNAFSKTGYVFSGWATSANGSVVYGNGASVTNLSSTQGAVVNLYAKWTPVTYTVNYNGNGATGGSTASSSHTYNTEKALTTNGFTNTGKTFSGWATSASGPLVYTDGQSVKNLTAVNGGTVTLYALWNCNSYTVTLDKQGGNDGTESVSATFGAEMPSITVPTKTGYIFGGYFSGTNGSGTQYYTSTGNGTRNYDIGSTATFYAKWTPITYTVSFDLNGGTGTAPANISVIYDQSFDVPSCNAVKTGYHIGTHWNINNTSSQIEMGGTASNLAETNGATVTVSLEWIANEYRVIFDGNGATSGSMSPIVCTYGVLSSLPANQFQNTGYAFQGWATPIMKAQYEAGYSVSLISDCDTILNLTTEETIVQLSAIWKANSYTIQFNGNGSEAGAMASVTLQYGQDFTIPENGFSKNGYTISGWSLSASGNAVYNDRATVRNLSSVEGSVVTLYVVWRPIDYSVRFNPNGGSGSSYQQNFKYNSAQELEANKFSYQGAVFLGWSTNASDTEPTYDNKQEVINLTNHDGNVIDFYAIWKTGSYIISYDGNGASSGFMQDSIHEISHTGNLLPNTYVKTGYHFAGWSLTKGGAKDYDNRQSVTDMTTVSGATIILYAVWEPNTYTVHYEKGNGTGAMDDRIFTYDTAANLDLCAFVKTGYSFLGWTTEEASTSPEYEDGGSVLNLTTAQDGEIVMYALWTKNTYYVKFNANGGTGEMQLQRFTYDESSRLHENAFTRAGYKFGGWNTSPADTAVYENRASVINLTSMPNNEISLYAVWIPCSYTIEFNATSGTGSMDPIQAVYGADTPLPACTFTKEGYSFAGWSTSAIDSSVAISDAGNARNLTDEDGGTATLYAVWSAINYTVHFDSNGGTGTMADQSITYDIPTRLSPSEFIKEGFVFLGWVPNTNYTEPSYNDKQIVTNLVNSETIVTLYAFWKQCAVVVSFDGNGAVSGTVPSIPLSTDESMVIPEGNYVRPGYQFAGWSTTQSGTASYSAGDTIVQTEIEQDMVKNGVFTLYAVWTPNECTVHYNGNGSTFGTMLDTTVYYDIQTCLRKNVFEKTGYLFLGWATNAAAVTPEYEDEAQILNLTMENGATVNLFALWQPKTYSVHYDANGGTGTINDTLMTYDEEKPTKLEGYTRTGYTFIGWSLDPDAADAQFYAGEPVKNLSTGDPVTLYAVWEKNAYSIVYELNGGEWISGFTPVTRRQADEMVALPSGENIRRIGYIFDGWYGSPVFNQKITQIQNVANSVYVYAKWIPENGTTGTAYWSLDYDEHTLTLSGEETEDYYDEHLPEFYQYRNVIEHIVIEPTVTVIGDYFFYGLVHVKDITNNSSKIKYIANTAFSHVGVETIDDIQVNTRANNAFILAMADMKSKLTTITNGTAQIDPPRANELRYTGNYQTLITAGSSTTGTVWYKVGENGEYSKSLPKEKDVGTYTVYYYSRGDEIHKDSEEGHITVTIGKRLTAVPTITAGSKTQTYTGAELSAVVSNPNSGRVIQSGTSKAVDAGTYTVFWDLKYPSIDEWEDETSATKSATWKISKATGSVTKAPTGQSITYNGNPQTVINAGNGTGTMYYSIDGINYSQTLPEITNAGQYTIYYYAAESKNYTQSTVGSITINIAKAGGSVTTLPVANELTYNGTSQALISAASGTGTVYYSVNDGAYSTAIPKAINAGTYRISYYAAESSNYSRSSTGTITVTIGKVSLAKPSLTNVSLTYTGSDLSPSISDFDTSLETKSGDLTKKNVGNYTITFSLNDVINYQWSDNTAAPVSYEWEIKKADGSVTAPAAINNIIYTGLSQPLVTAGSSTTGTMYYKVGSGAYSTDIPEALGAGTYTVYYYSKGDSNHNDTPEGSVSVTIGKATGYCDVSKISISFKAGESATYTATGSGTLYVYSATGCTATISGSTVTVTSNTAGTGYVQIGAYESANYKAAISRNTEVTIIRPYIMPDGMSVSLYMPTYVDNTSWAVIDTAVLGFTQTESGTKSHAGAYYYDPIGRKGSVYNSYSTMYVVHNPTSSLEWYMNGNSGSTTSSTYWSRYALKFTLASTPAYSSVNVTYYVSYSNSNVSKLGARYTTLGYNQLSESKTINIPLDSSNSFSINQSAVPAYTGNFYLCITKIEPVY